MSDEGRAYSYATVEEFANALAQAKPIGEDLLVLFADKGIHPVVALLAAAGCVAVFGKILKLPPEVLADLVTKGPVALIEFEDDRPTS